jgi:hypothetical protein
MWGNGAQDRIVRVSLLRASIQRFAIDRHQRRVEEQPYHQVRVGNEGFAEGYEIGASIRDGLVCAWLIKPRMLASVFKVLPGCKTLSSLAAVASFGF